MSDDITPELAAWLFGTPEPEPEVVVPSMAEVKRMIKELRFKFVGIMQLRVMEDACNGEEGDFFKLKIKEVYDLVTTMPKTYEQEELGENAVIHLHYFAGGRANWWITERDKLTEQHQAFGRADLFGDGGEMGYISIYEILKNGGELDLYWTPITLKQLKEKKENDEQTHIQNR